MLALSFGVLKVNNLKERFLSRRLQNFSRSFFIVSETGQAYYLFGQGKARELARRFNTQVLSSIPLISDIRLGGDEGKPVAFHQGPGLPGHYFHQLANEFYTRSLAPLSNPFQELIN